MASQKRGGIIQFTANGVLYEAKGNFTYNLGLPKRDAVIGSDGVHGFTEKPQVAFIEGEITDRGDLNLSALVSMQDATVALTMGTGKLIMLRNAWFAGEGTGNSEEGNVGIRFEGKSGEEIT